MNSNFTDEQIKAYAKKFREGDAIWVEGQWHEAVKIGLCYQALVTHPYEGRDPLMIDCVNFHNTLEYPYRVTTLNHYKPQGGEKIVWLGESDYFRTFGKVYVVSSHMEYQDDDGVLLPISSPLWAVIPSYKQVKNLSKITITEKVNQVVKEKIKRELSPYEQIANEHNITKEELSFILDECDNGRKDYIINCLISLRSQWHENNQR